MKQFYKDVPPASALTQEMIIKAFNKLSPEDRDVIDDIAIKLIKAVKSKRPATQFGRYQAIELLAKLGFWMVQRDIQYISIGG